MVLSSLGRQLAQPYHGHRLLLALLTLLLRTLHAREHSNERKRYAGDLGKISGGHGPIGFPFATGVCGLVGGERLGGGDRFGWFFLLDGVKVAQDGGTGS